MLFTVFIASTLSPIIRQLVELSKYRICNE